MASTRRKAILWVFGVLAALLVAFVAALLLWSVVARSRLEARLAALRKAGEPLTIGAVIASWPDLPPERNAAPVLEAAFKALDAQCDEKLELGLPVVGAESLPEPGEPLEAERLEAVRKCLSNHAETLRLLHQAAALGECRFHMAHYGPNGATDPRQLASMRGAVRLLVLESIERAEAGRGDEAAESLRAGLRIGYAFRREPCALTAMVRVACNAIVIMHVERWVTRGKPSPGGLRRVEEALDDEADTKRLQPPLIGMRCLLASSILGAPAGSNPVFRAYGRGVALRSLEVVEAYVEAARRPFPECFLEAERLGAKLEARIPWYDPVSREVAGSLPRFWLEEQRIVARLGGTRVALAALRYKAAHGRLPARLQDLVPDFIDSVPLDPFDGKPLRYRKADDGFVVYAVGENGADDGGQTELVKGKRLDIGFRVRWPKKTR